jgi:type II secretory pathway component PulC
MLFWILQISVVSIIFIGLVHHLITYFKTTLTIPKVKDLVNKPSKKYEEMFSVMYKNNDTTPIEKLVIEDIIPKPMNMKNELKHFLKEKFKTETPFSSLLYSSSSI